ncbi:MAG: SH3 domain-containing protein [Devosia sp.]
MRLQNKMISLALAGSVLLGMAGTAMASQAVATTNVNVRSGPSSGYGVVDTLRRNEVVNVTECRSGWCYVEKAGPDGWVSANYLQQGGRQQYSTKPSVNFSFSFGTPPAPQRPQRPPRPGHGGWDNNWGGGHHGGWNRPSPWPYR